mgnify:CR=1 FL=1
MAAPAQPSKQATAARLNSPVARDALLMALGMGVTVGLAVSFEKIGGYMLCLLCLQQRIPYYIGIPLMAVTFVLALVAYPLACRSPPGSLSL